MTDFYQINFGHRKKDIIYVYAERNNELVDGYLQTRERPQEK